VELEKAKVSGVDLCGNGIIIVPGRMYIVRTGQPNLYPESRSLNNPYRGRSAMVARLILGSTRVKWDSLNELAKAVENAGTKMSISQVSKAVQALENDLIVRKINGGILLLDYDLLLDKLSSAWRKPALQKSMLLRLPSDIKTLLKLGAVSSLRWAITGQSSVTRYATFAQGGPLRVGVSDLSAALNALNGIPEAVFNFADVELVETDEEGFFFGNEIDEEGLRWASRLQTWIELSIGDARQKEAARDIRKDVLNEEWLKRGKT
jgi:hypothetical protein